MGTTINLANIALGFDVSKIQKGVDLSAAEIRKLSTSFQNSISGIDRYNAAMEIVDKARKAGALTAQRVVEIEASLAAKYQIGVQEAKAAAKAAEDLAKARSKQVESTKQVEKSQSNNVLSDMKSTLAQYAGMAAAFRGLQTSLSLAATAESNKISLEVLTGSLQKANYLFEGFIQLDRSSPLSRQDFSRASQTLIGYGLAAEGTMPMLRALSEVSIGNAERFQSLALAFGQVTANGRLMGQEVLQMVNAGFNPLQEISRTTGTSMLDLKKQMEAGAISAEMVENAFKSATSEGGRFHDMNVRLRDSAAGQFAKMKSDVELLATEIGTNLLPAAKALMDVMNAGADSKGKGGLLPELASNFAAGIEGMMAIASDAFTNLDENSVGTKFDTFLEKIGKQNAEREMEKLRHVLTAEEAAIRERNMAKKHDDERRELQRIAAEQKEAEALLLAENVQKEKDITEERQKQARLANERVREAQKDFDKLKSDVNKKQDDNPNNIAAAVAPALRAGSVEAYRFLMNQRNEAAEIAREQADIAQQQLSIMEQTLNATQTMQVIGVAGRTA